MTEHKIIIRDEELRRAVESAQAKLAKDTGIKLSMSKTAARLLRMGLERYLENCACEEDENQSRGAADEKTIH